LQTVPKEKRQLINQRAKNANKTQVKLQSLANIRRNAKLLFSGAGFPKVTWGFQISGMSKMQWLKLETAAANITGIKKGRCRYSTLCIACGPNGHPFARGIKELFVLWFKVILRLILHMASTQPQIFAGTTNSFLLIRYSILQKIKQF